MNDVKISVIVPVYNMEPYIDKCLQSIISQSLREIEIIIIDDGSTDNSFKKCAEYVGKDNRIKLIHKKNSGLSSARNAGLDIAKGEYITFVDSDDYLSPDVLECSVCLMQKERASLGIFRIGYLSDIMYCPRQGMKGEYCILNNRELLHNYFSHSKLSISTCACGKIYKRTIWSTRRFREGIIYEDAECMYKIFSDIDKALYINKIGYIQLIRKGSIIQSSYSDKNEIIFDILRNQLDFMKIKFPGGLYIDTVFFVGRNCKHELLKMKRDHTDENFPEMYDKLMSLYDDVMPDLDKNKWKCLKQYIGIRTVYDKENRKRLRGIRQ